jgi:hypothetical protein
VISGHAPGAYATENALDESSLAVLPSQPDGLLEQPLNRDSTTRIWPSTPPLRWNHVERTTSVPSHNTWVETWKYQGFLGWRSSTSKQEGARRWPLPPPRTCTKFYTHRSISWIARYYARHNSSGRPPREPSSKGSTWTTSRPSTSGMTGGSKPPPWWSTSRRATCSLHCCRNTRFES